MRMLGLTALFIGVLFGIFALTWTATNAVHEPGDGTTVKMARPTWDTGWFHARVYPQLLQALGYDVPRLVILKNRAFYTSVSRGEVDLWVNGWFPTHDTYADDFEKGARRIGYVAKGGALQGYLVSRKHAEKYGIEQLADFKREEVKDAFDSDGDGRAEMVACPPGWACEEVIAHHWDAYGMHEHVDLIQSDFYPAAMTEALARHRNGEPIFFYTWAPNWTVGMLEPGEDVLWITVEKTELPESLAHLEDATVVEDLEGCARNPCNLGWPANDIRPVANEAFLENNPAAATLLEEARIPLADISAQNAKMWQGENSPEDLERHAHQWIESHRDKVDRWLREARDAAM